MKNPFLAHGGPFFCFPLRPLALVITLAPLTLGCSMMEGAFKTKEDLTPEKIMEAHGGGPKVEGMEASLLKSAKEATERGDHPKAITYYEQLTKQVPGVRAYELAMVESIRRSGNLERADADYDKLLDKYPDDAEVLEGKGLTELAQGDSKSAQRYFTKALEKDDKRWRSVNGTGIVLSTQGNPEEALKYYRRALDLSPRNPSVLNNIGLTLAIQGDYERAVKALELGMKNLPKSSKSKEQLALNLALVYGLSGDLQAAERAAKPYLKETELYNNLGYYAYLAKKPEMAKTYLNMALTESKEHYARAWDNLEKVMRKERGEKQ